MPREENPPNLPHLRSIELFCAHLKSKVYENDYTAKNLESLKVRIRKKLNEISPEYFSELMRKVKTRVRKAADYGYDYMFS